MALYGENHVSPHLSLYISQYMKPLQGVKDEALRVSQEKKSKMSDNAIASLGFVTSFASAEGMSKL